MEERARRSVPLAGRGSSGGPVETVMSKRIFKLVALGVLVALAGAPVAGAGYRDRLSARPFQQSFYGMSAVSASDGWAVGFTNSKTLAERWDGSSWTVVATPSPAGGSDFLTAASMVSSTDAWAVGNTSEGPLGSKAIILHWDGASWKQVPDPDPAVYLVGVSTSTATDGWAVGYKGKRPAMLHWDGNSWQAVALPVGRHGSLNGVSSLSPTDAWAVGAYGAPNPSKPLVLHWNGTSWKTVSVPVARGHQYLTAVSARTAGDVWAVGSEVVHWNGKRWKRVAAFTGSGLTAVSAHTATDVWAVGSQPPENTLTIHWNGRRWRIVASPSPGGPGTGALLAGVSARGARNVWAVGDYGTPSGGAKLLRLRWRGGHWKV